MLRRKSSLRTGSATVVCQDLLRRTIRKKKLMRKMSDIIQKEMQSDSDEDDLETPDISKELPTVKITPLKRHSMVGLAATTQKIREDITNTQHAITPSSNTIGSQNADFTLDTDTDDDVKSTFDSTISVLHPSRRDPTAIPSPPTVHPPRRYPTSVPNPTRRDPASVPYPPTHDSPETILGDSASESNTQEEHKRKRKNCKQAGKGSTEYYKHYKQYYRTAWEQVPEFKGWLSCVEGVPARAKCTYCKIELTAHSVSLMKHVASAKHQRNAEKTYMMNSSLHDPQRIFKNTQEGDPLASARSQTSLLVTQDTPDENMHDIFDNVHIILEDDDNADDVVVKEDLVTSNEKEHNIVTFNDKETNIVTLDDRRDIVTLNDREEIVTLSDKGDIVTLNEKVHIVTLDDNKEHTETLGDKEQIVTIHDLEEEFSEDERNNLIQVVKLSKNPVVFTTNSASDRFQPISTHVIDSHAGLPISNLEITLYKLVNGGWRFVSEISTNAGGRASDFMPDTYSFQCGRYKLHYHVFKYFERRKINSIFPFIEVAFDVRRRSDHLHFPLIVSANGYNVYKGCAF